jgi:membrane protein
MTNRTGRKIRWSWAQFQRSMAALADCSSHARRRNPLQRFACYVRRISDAYGTHQCSLMACACAFCAILSLVPLLVIGISILGFVAGGSANALHEVIVAIRGYVPINPAFLRDMLAQILKDRRIIGFFGLIGLIYGAHQTFLAMQPAMNLVWVVSEDRHWLRQRAIALGATFLTIVLLGADLAASTTVALILNRNLPLLSTGATSLLLQIMLSVIPILLTTTLFTLLYRLLPARVVPVKPALIGASVAALLWQATKVGFGIFLVYSHSYDRLYGSLSSLVVLVVWTYYSMAILLLGAEIAADYESMRHGVRAAERRSHSGADLGAAHGNAPQDRGDPQITQITQMIQTDGSETQIVKLEENDLEGGRDDLPEQKDDHSAPK